MALLPLVFLATILVATSHASSNVGHTLQINLLRPQTGSGGIKGVSCASWRLGIETYNLHDWKTVPAECENYVGHYMLGDMYRKDSRVVTNAAAAYAKTLNLTRNGKEVWVFDVDETTLSNLHYYANHGFGAEVFNATLFNAWVLTGKAVALPESLKLYKTLMKLGIKIVFLTGRTEDKRKASESNLKMVGYTTWEKFLLKGASKTGLSAIQFKANERKGLEDQGYTIVGNMGDQWSDLLGAPTGSRTFKLPDPMYYIG